MGLVLRLRKTMFKSYLKFTIYAFPRSEVFPWTPPPSTPRLQPPARLALCRNVHGDTPMNRKCLLKFIFKIQIFLLINFLGFFFRYLMMRKDRCLGFTPSKTNQIGHKSMGTVWQIFVKTIYCETLFKSLILYICAKHVLKHLFFYK